MVHTPRSMKRAIVLGLRHRCPSCGEGKIYAGFLKIRDKCGTCGTELHHHRADDMPSWLTLLVVGHLVVPMVLSVYKATNWPMWYHYLLWPVVSMALILLMLPRIKAAVVGLQWALRLGGFEEA